MRIFHFTEMPYPHLPEDYMKQYGSIRVILPNRLIDPQIAHQLYTRYLDEFEYADELGLDIMLNEHHQTATCIDAAISISAAALVRRTKNAKILLLGHPIPHREPLRVAEETAMLDCISGGRILSGFIRGVGTEVHPANTNPAQNRDRFYEAHDLIVKAWTTREPFYWEGKFYQHRFVNPFPRPYQQPHPPIWTSSGSNLEHIRWASEQDYTFASFLTPYEVTKRLFDEYRNYRIKKGMNQAGTDKLALLVLCYVAETDEKAEKEGQEMLWYLRNNAAFRFKQPPGYSPVSDMIKMFKPKNDGIFLIDRNASFQTLIDNGILIAGSPKTVVNQIKRLNERVGGLGNLLCMNQAGFLSHEKTIRSMKLLAKEVYPEVKKLGLVSI